MNNRTDRLKLLDLIINQGDLKALKFLTLPMYQSVLIFEQEGEGLTFSQRLNAELPKKYLDRILDDKDLDTMLAPSGKSVVFLLPDNGRD